jgi:hypothetical protein
VALKFGQQLFDSQAQRLELLLFDPERRGAPIIAFDQQSERAVAGLANRLGL